MPPVDRSQPPPSLEVRPFRFPPFERQRLANGLTLLAARVSRVPLVTLELVVPAGAEWDPGETPGLASFTAALLDEGTVKRSGPEIARGIEILGGYLNTGVHWSSAWIGTGVLSHHLPAGLDVLAEVATRPSFPQQEIERLRQQRLADLLRRRDRPDTLADDLFARVVYGDTVYGHPRLGTEASLSRLQRPEIAAFFQRHYVLSASALVAVGDLDPESLVAALAPLVERITPRPGPEPPAIQPPELPEVVLHILDRPGATQTELRLGHAAVPRRHPDFIPLTVLNSILGGKFISRINLNLRERHGYTYGAHSQFVSRLGPGPFVVNSAVVTDAAGAAVREILGELERIQEEPVEPAELAETQTYLRGVFPYTLQTIGDLARRLADLAIYGFPDDYYETYLTRMEQVTREEILEMARRHLKPHRLAVVAVGPARLLRSQLEGLGPMTVWEGATPGEILEHAESGMQQRDSDQPAASSAQAGPAASVKARLD